MSKVHALCLAIALCALGSGCGDSSGPIAPSPGGTTGYEGQWVGTTSQGRPISFSVSSQQKVTAITVEYNYSGCAGVKTFANLSLDIGSPPSPTSPQPGPGFGYGTGSPEAPEFTQLSGWFTSDRTANGTIIFANHPDCENAVVIGIWSASRR